MRIHHVYMFAVPLTWLMSNYYIIDKLSNFSCCMHLQYFFLQNWIANDNLYIQQTMTTIQSCKPHLKSLLPIFMHAEKAWNKAVGGRACKSGCITITYWLVMLPVLYVHTGCKLAIPWNCKYSYSKSSCTPRVKDCDQWEINADSALSQYMQQLELTQDIYSYNQELQLASCCTVG